MACEDGMTCAAYVVSECQCGNMGDWKVDWNRNIEYNSGD